MISILILIFVAFFPSIIYLIILRNTELYEREPWGTVFKVFFFGAIFGVLLAVVLEIILIYLISKGIFYLRGYEIIARNIDKITILIPLIIVAPFAEEFSKVLCVFSAKRDINEIEDGLVYGAAAGLGFSATENLLYEYHALVEGGILAWIIVSVLRSISSSLLHASASAISGLGYSRKRLRGKGLLKGYFVAVFLHAAFNFLASIPIIITAERLAYLAVLIIAIILAISSFTYVRRSILVLDRYGEKKRYRRGYRREF